MSSARELLFMGAMVMQSIQAYRTGGAPRLPKGCTFVQSFGTSTDPRLGFIAESPKQIIVAFRGTENPTDIVYSLDMTQIPYPYRAGAGMTHRGFTNLYAQLRNTLARTLRRQLQYGKTLLVAGHSLGAALATLTALDHSTNARHFHPTVATFGSPRIGDWAFAACYDKQVPNTTRVFNVNDLVPRFPPEALGYRHVKRGLSVRFDQGTNHAMSGYYEALCQTYPKACRSLAI